MSGEAGKYWETSPERFLLPKIYHDMQTIMGWDEAVRVGLSIWLSQRPKEQIDGSSRASAYFPKTFNEAKPPAVAAIIGVEATRKMIHEFPGQILEFHGIGAATIWRRNAGVAEQTKQYRRAIVAVRFGITERTVSRILAAEKG